MRKWIIRSRLCLRGFKDLDRDSVASYAGTSQRFSQRILCSEAVIRGWDIATTDISKAFLQGVTYKELAELTKEPLREVNFELPAYCIPYLRMIPGWEDFNPATEVIHCDKPGTGCNDAPRCFSLKLAKVTKDLCGMNQCTVDNELCYLHETVGQVVTHEANGGKTGEPQLRLRALMAKHVDDLKLTGNKETVIWILSCIEKVFGKLKIEWNNFTNCGISHTQDADTKAISLDQHEYVSQIKTIAHCELSTKSADDYAGAELHALYWSILGAINYALMTRCDIAVFVSALQRHAQKPKIVHCKRLNAVVRWAQRNPQKVWYRPLFESKANDTGTHLRLYSDAAFKREEESGHSIRGALYIRCRGSKFEDMKCSTHGHLIDHVSRNQRRVVRSTFSAELGGAGDTIDKAFILAQIFHEINTGQNTSATARHLRMYGGYTIPMCLYIDALSVFTAIVATFIKTPAENGLLVHLHYIRELLDYGVLDAFAWTDTRDMLADGMTKGAIDRKDLHEVMAGNIRILHDTIRLWRPSTRQVLEQ